MAWDDWVFGILTGGLYNVGKAAYQAGGAAEQAGNAAEQAGTALAVIGTTAEEVGKQLTSLLKETEELITIKRLSPRDESELWEEEKKRLADLRKIKADLEKQINDLGVTEPSDFSWDFLSDTLENMMKRIQLVSSLVVVNNEINEILYQEPGVLTTTIYNASETLERFNTIEQPKIETIMDSVEDNLEVTEDTLKEIRKLFVIRQKVPVPEIELTFEMKEKLKALEMDTGFYKGLIGKRSNISKQLMNAMGNIPETRFEITEKGIKVANLNIAKGSPAISGGSGIDEPKGEPVKKFESAASDTGTLKKQIENLGRLNMVLARRPQKSLATIQPQGVKVSAALNTKFEGYQRNYAFFRAKENFYDRELLKIGKKVDKIKYRWEDKPGVIPQTLDELKAILERVRTQEQPRIETTLDLVNSNLEESRNTLSGINSTLDSVKGITSFINKNSTLILIGLGIFGAVIFLDLLVALIVLVKMAFL